MRKLVKKMAARGDMNAGPVIVKWRSQTGTPGNPNRESSQADETWQDHEQEYQAFIHYVSAGASTYQRHSEVQVGDVILDFPGNIDLRDKRHPQFIIDDSGTVYVRKDAGVELMQTWDVRCNGVPITMTLLLRPQAGTLHTPAAAE